MRGKRKRPARRPEVVAADKERRLLAKDELRSGPEAIYQLGRINGLLDVFGVPRQHPEMEGVKLNTYGRLRILLKEMGKL